MKYKTPVLNGVFSFLMMISASSFAVTPSDVFHESRYIIASLQALQPADANPRVPGIQVGKSPLHAYTKSIELLEKINRYNSNNGRTSISIPGFPAQKVTPDKVLALMQTARNQVEAIAQSKGARAGTVGDKQFGKTPSDVYEQVWQASFLMDSLVPPLKPADVLRNATMAETALQAIASSMGQSVEFPALQPVQGKKPVDANIQAFKLLYKIAKLERKLGLQPLLVPSFPAGKIFPEDVFDTTGNILAELTRITTHKNLPAIRRVEASTGKVSPNDVYAQLVRLNRAIAQLI